MLHPQGFDDLTNTANPASPRFGSLKQCKECCIPRFWMTRTTQGMLHPQGLDHSANTANAASPRFASLKGCKECCIPKAWIARPTRGMVHPQGLDHSSNAGNAASPRFGAVHENPECDIPKAWITRATPAKHPQGFDHSSRGSKLHRQGLDHQRNPSTAASRGRRLLGAAPAPRFVGSLSSRGREETLPSASLHVRSQCIERVLSMHHFAAYSRCPSRNAA
jgi:hypothetical protein